MNATEPGPGHRAAADCPLLLIEDDKESGEMLTFALQDAGFPVRWEREVNPALDYLSDPAGERPALILLDLGLGEQDGVELVRDLLARGVALPPIVIISARSPISVNVAADFAEAAAVIRKPFSLAYLLDTIARVLAT